MSYEPTTEQTNLVLHSILEGIQDLKKQHTVKDYYTTAEFAERVGLAEFTIREYCRHGRIKAFKKRSGRGAHAGWAISHAELLRYEKEGLLPIQTAN